MMVKKKLIFVVDDEELVRWTLEQALKEGGYDVKSYVSAEDMLGEFELRSPRLILLDIKLPGISGIEALEKIRNIYPEQSVIMITAYGDVETAIKSMKLGARDYITKPFEIEELKMVVDRIIDEAEVKGEWRKMQTSLKEKYSFGKMIGNSEPMQAVWEVASKVAKIATARVLITGESGTGKGQLAKAIHYESPQASGHLVEVSCVNIPETLLESELFGYEPGAFTDAKKRRTGLIEEADGGTLFLDEIGDMAPALQSKMLKVIEEKVFYRLGGNTQITVDIRLITATNRDLAKLVKEGKFREDLYYRLNVVTINLPPLRERSDDIILLAKHFMNTLNEELGRDFKSLAPDAMRALLLYPWPGNVRELMNTIERIMILEQGPVIKLSYLPPDIREFASSQELQVSALETLDQIEKRHLLRALQVTNYNVSRAAELLGINRTTILRKFEKWGMDLGDLRKKITGDEEEESID